MNDSNARIFGIAAISAALLSTVGRLLTVLFFTDFKTGVYSSGNLFPQIFGYLLAAVCIGLIAWGYLSKKTFAKREAPVSTSLTTFTTAVFGFAMLAHAAVVLYTSVVLGRFTAFETILIISAVLSGIYYLAVIYSRKTSPNAFAILSMAPIVWCIAALVELYFDMSVLISSPARIWVQLAYLSLMVFLLAETRFNINHESTILYAPSAAIATIFLLSVSIPNLVCADKMLIGNTERLVTYVLMLVAGIYALSRLISFCFISETQDEQ